MTNGISGIGAESAKQKQVIKGVSNRDAALVSGVVSTGAGLFAITRAVDRGVANSVIKGLDTLTKNGKTLALSQECQYGSALITKKGSLRDMLIGGAVALATGLFAKYCYDKT